jgi:phage protein D
MSGVRHCVIRVDGQEQEPLYEDLIAVEVSERVREPSSFALQVGIFKKDNGGWTRLDETSAASGGFTPWQPISIAVSFDDNPDVLIDGLVAGVSPRFPSVEGESYLLVWGYDKSYAMNLEEKVVAWPDKKYSDIATELFQAYGLDPTVTDTQVLQEKDKDLLIQRGTDWQFLKQLAKRVGFDVSVRANKGFFRPPDLSQAPQKDLAVHFGPLVTNVVWFEPRVVGDMPSKITMARVNAVEKKIEKVEVTQSPLRALGARATDDLRQGANVPVSPVVIAPADPLVSEQAMEALATGIRRSQDWVVTGEGEIDGNVYGRALRADGVVLIKGAGNTFSGRYYVTEVTHRITPESYTQHFKVIRNGVDVQGDESFEGEEASTLAPGSEVAS